MQVIVPDQLWVISETVLEDVPNIQRRELLSICTHAEQPDGGMLVIERSIDHHAWPARPARGVRGWQFVATSITPGASAPPSSSSSAPFAGAEAGDGAEQPDAESVVLERVVQVDLGNVSARFTNEYALEAADIVSGLTSYLALPTWPDERTRLQAASGPMLPTLSPDVAQLEPLLAHDAAGGSLADEEDGAEEEDGADDEAPPPRTGAPFSTDSALHRAQVLAFAELRGGPYGLPPTGGAR